MKNISNKKLAKKAGLTEDTVYKVLRGKVKPSVDCLTKLAIALNVSVDDVLRHIASHTKAGTQVASIQGRGLKHTKGMK